MRKKPDGFLYPKDARLRKRADYSLCYDSGRKYFTRHFIVFVRESDGETVRTGMAVSKKIGKACMRNRIKRLLREFFRLHVTNRCCGRDVVVIARKGISETIALSQLEEELMPIVTTHVFQREEESFCSS